MNEKMSKLYLDRDRLIHELFTFASYGKHTEIIKVARKSGIDVNVQNKNGDTLLHVCARFGREDAVREMLCEGANPNVKNNLGLKPSDVAKQKNFDYISSVLKSMEYDEGDDNDMVDNPGMCIKPPEGPSWIEEQRMREKQEERELFQINMF